jgi:ribosome-associated heat shock protein Hsp15
VSGRPEDAAAGDAQSGCRIDVWLWRARFFKTRALAARFVEQGRLRLTRAGAAGESRLDKPGRTLKPGDGLVFALAGRLVAIRVEDLGERRGPAGEARGLYSPLEGSSGREQNCQH